MENSIIREVKYDETNQLYDLLQQAFKRDIEPERFDNLYNLAKENENTHILGYYTNDILVRNTII